jgi:hypothetical protein
MTSRIGDADPTTGGGSICNASGKAFRRVWIPELHSVLWNQHPGATTA